MCNRIRTKSNAAAVAAAAAAAAASPSLFSGGVFSVLRTQQHKLEYIFVFGFSATISGLVFFCESNEN